MPITFWDTHKCIRHVRSRLRKIAYFGNESLVEGTGGASQLEGLGVLAMEESSAEYRPGFSVFFWFDNNTQAEE